VYVYEMPSMRRLDSLPISLVRNPTYMAVNIDRQWAYLVDEEANYLARMDLSNGNIAAYARVGQRPHFLLCMQEHQWIAVASALSNSVLLLDAQTLDKVMEIPLDSEPQGLLLHDNSLYIAEKMSSTIAVYSLLDRKISTRFRVGTSPSRLQLGDEYIYISNYGSGSVSVFVPGQFNAHQDISIGTNPREMAYSESRRWLYVVDEKTGEISVLDPTLNRVIGRVQLETQSMDIAVMQ